MSIDLKSEDSNYRKFFGVSKHLNTDVFRDVKRIIEFTPDGNIQMFDTTVVTDYDFDTWYHFDMMWTGSEVECYVNGELKTTSAKDLPTYFKYNDSTIYNKWGFWITDKDNKGNSLYAPDEVDASLDIDNFVTAIYDDSYIQILFRLINLHTVFLNH